MLTKIWFIRTVHVWVTLCLGEVKAVIRADEYGKSNFPGDKDRAEEESPEGLDGDRTRMQSRGHVLGDLRDKPAPTAACPCPTNYSRKEFHKNNRPWQKRALVEMKGTSVVALHPSFSFCNSFNR